MRRPIGDKAGEVDGVAAEVIDAAEFNKRYIAFKAGKAEAESEAEPQKPAEKAEPPPKPAEEPVSAPKVADGWVPVEPTSEPREEKPSDKKPTPRHEPTSAQKPVLTEAEMRELVTQSVEDLQSALVSVSTPGLARLGEASPFVRSVIRILKNTMPKPAGMRGRVLIQLMVGASGDIEAIRVARSSGRPELDRFVLERVAKTKLAPPPATASPRERIFQISYEYN
jgi:protein TonB